MLKKLFLITLVLSISLALGLMPNVFAKEPEPGDEGEMLIKPKIKGALSILEDTNDPNLFFEGKCKGTDIVFEGFIDVDFRTLTKDDLIDFRVPGDVLDEVGVDCYEGPVNSLIITKVKKFKNTCSSASAKIEMMGVVTPDE